PRAERVVAHCQRHRRRSSGLQGLGRLEARRSKHRRRRPRTKSTGRDPRGVVNLRVDMRPPVPYKPKHHVRIVTAASLFDGHDAAINIMRRLIQASGVEVIHLGHNRSAQEVVECAIQEDAQGIAVTSYQGGHLEYFKYMFDLLKEK